MNIIQSQMERYVSEGYPENNGLARTTVIFRKHNKDDITKHSEDCWEEIKYGSKREQLSFNYIAWKNDLKFNYIQEDIDNNQYFKYMKKWRQTQSK